MPDRSLKTRTFARARILMGFLTVAAAVLAHEVSELLAVVNGLRVRGSGV